MKDVAEVTADMCRHITELFANEGLIHPAVLGLNPNEPMTVFSVSELMNGGKNVVARIISGLRETHELVLFVSGSWLVKTDGADLDVAPSEHPDRQEVVLVTAYHGKEIVCRSTTERRHKYGNITDSCNSDGRPFDCTGGNVPDSLGLVGSDKENLHL